MISLFEAVKSGRVEGTDFRTKKFRTQNFRTQNFRSQNIRTQNFRTQKCMSWMWPPINDTINIRNKLLHFIITRQIRINWSNIFRSFFSFLLYQHFYRFFESNLDWTVKNRVKMDGPKSWHTVESTAAEMDGLWAQTVHFSSIKSIHWPIFFKILDFF